jgi:hypothetical protein
MELRAKAAAVSFLALAALCLGACALRGIAAEGGAQPDYYVGAAAEPAGAQYVLRDCGGYIGVYAAGKPAEPEQITDIEVSRLRDTDRKLLYSGIPVSDRGELLALLEDFGS